SGRSGDARSPPRRGQARAAEISARRLLVAAPHAGTPSGIPHQRRNRGFPSGSLPLLITAPFPAAFPRSRASRSGRRSGWKRSYRTATHWYPGISSMLRRTLLLLAALAAATLLVSQQPRDPLETGFADPPPEARLRCYWWWLNGNTNEAAITRDLEQMKLNGYGGALLVDANGSEQQNNRMVPAGPTFASDRWRQLYRHALKEAARLDLEISLNIESGWNLGGPTVKPEQGAKLLTWSRTAVQGGAEVRRALPRPPAKIDYYRDVAVLAYPLHHGEALPARPIRQLAVKSASQ